jgi:hypothetical protein
VHRTRQIAASPYRSAREAWETAKELVATTLERSPNVVAGTVAGALAPLDGVATTLIAAGHLDARPLTLVDADLHVDLRFIGGDASFVVEENLAPVPGGASASTDWVLYINPPTHLVGVVDAACAASAHLKRGKSPAFTEAASVAASSAWAIDPDALRRIDGAS